MSYVSDKIEIESWATNLCNCNRSIISQLVPVHPFAFTHVRFKKYVVDNILFWIKILVDKLSHLISTNGQYSTSVRLREG